MEDYVLIEGELYFVHQHYYIKVTEHFSACDKTLDSIFADYITHISASA